MALRLFHDYFDPMHHSIMHNIHPSHLLDQHFGMGIPPETLLNPLATVPMSMSPFAHLQGNYFRPWRLNSKDAGSTVKCDKDSYVVNLDVQQFTPEEIKVKVVDNTIVVEAKHEEKQDEHGYISRHFVRKYVLPKGYEIKDISSSLSTDGVLTIMAPKSGVTDTEERVIAIARTGPHKPIKEVEKTEKKDEKAEI